MVKLILLLLAQIFNLRKWVCKNHAGCRCIDKNLPALCLQTMIL